MKKLPLTVTFLSCLLLWFIFAGLTPIVQDEAYYFMWSNFLGAGFFDHPPMVAFMASGHQLFPTSAMGGRLGTIAVATLTMIAALRLFRTYGIRDDRSLLIALIFSQFNLLALIGGFLTTPDTILILFWTLAVTEAMLALSGSGWRWLTAGLFTGLGLWSKYTMMIIGPVFLWGLIVETRHGRRENGLASPWPYLGGIVALAVFLPHLQWNANHDWITFKFQLRHGFSLDRPELSSESLPVPERRDPLGPEHALASAFHGLQEAQAMEELKPKPWDFALKTLNKYFGFYGSQIGLWGFLLLPAIIAWGRRQKNRIDLKARKHVPVGMGVHHTVIASIAVPLFLFGLIALKSKVEANWSAMYILGAAALIGRYLAPFVTKPAFFAALNVLVVSAVVAHAKTGILPLREHRDRIMSETHGYENLAELVRKLDAPVFSDSYQIAAMVRFYQPSVKIRQWPGITRDSEFLRRPQLADINFEKIVEIGSFWLITTDSIPPKIKGFRPIAMAQLRDCKGGGIQVIRTTAAQNFDARCKSLIHEWYLVNYSSL